MPRWSRQAFLQDFPSYVVQVHTSSEFSSRCREQGGEVELRDTVEPQFIGFGRVSIFQVVFVIRALSTCTSEISLPSR